MQVNVVQEKNIPYTKVYKFIEIFRRQQLCCVSYCIHSGYTNLLLLLLLLLLLAGTLSRSGKP